MSNRGKTIEQEESNFQEHILLHGFPFFTIIESKKTKMKMVRRQRETKDKEKKENKRTFLRWSGCISNQIQKPKKIDYQRSSNVTTKRTNFQLYFPRFQEKLKERLNHIFPIHPGYGLQRSSPTSNASNYSSKQKKADPSYNALLLFRLHQQS